MSIYGFERQGSKPNDKEKKQSGVKQMGSVGIGYYVKIILMIVIIFAAAYFVTRYSAKTAKRGSGFGVFNRSINMKILDSLAISKDKQLIIVSVGERVFLLGASGNRIEKLEELDPTTLKPEESGEGFSGGAMGEKFKSILSERFGKLKP
jgi:flagellar biosynthetic protein FliO